MRIHQPTKKVQSVKPLKIAVNNPLEGLTLRVFDSGEISGGGLMILCGTARRPNSANESILEGIDF